MRVQDQKHGTIHQSTCFAQYGEAEWEDTGRAWNHFLGGGEVGSHVQECGPGHPYLMISKKKGLPPTAVLLHAFSLDEQKGRESQSPSVQVSTTSKYRFDTFKQIERDTIVDRICHVPLTTAFYVDRIPGLPRAANL